MIPVEWIAFLIPFAATLLMALEKRKMTLMLLLLLVIGSTFVSVILAYLNSVLTQTQFVLQMKDFIVYIFDAFIGAILIPVANYLASLKVE
ncbi:MAG: hypothetical protein QW734_01995 [Candidatus Bathyarchaeia archaeon]